MKTQDKLILAIIFIIATFGACSLNAQNKMNIQAGYKAVSIGYTFQDEEFLNFGLSASVVESGIVEKRANRNDVNNKVHVLQSSLVPALFGTVGATFDNVTITGKFGGAYLQQTINNTPDPQNIYFAVGCSIDYQINDRFGAIVTYDSVNAVMAGVTIKLTE